MSRSWKTTILGLPAVAAAVLLPATVLSVLVLSVLVIPGTGMAYDGEGPAGSNGSELGATAVIEPGREGIVRVGGYEGVPLGAGSVLTLTAPSRARVTGTPFAAGGYRGAVTPGGGSGTYTLVSEPGEPVSGAWRGRTFPFVLSVSANAEPGTRLPDCALVLRDADGTVRQRGSCTVTVGLPAPTLSRPVSGVPLGALPETSGMAYPGARVTVRDAQEDEVCAATAAPDSRWSCVPARALPPGVGRLQATATFNGVGAMSEQIDIVVAYDGRLGEPQ